MPPASRSDCSTKDVKIASDLAGELGVMAPVCAVTFNALANAREALGYSADFTAAHKILERRPSPARKRPDGCAEPCSRRGGVAPRLAAGTAAASAQAQDFPNRPIKLITLTTPGGSLDTVARTIARYLPDQIGGQQVVVENRVGAGGNIGADAVAKSPPDGYTIGMVTISTHGINPTLYGAKMPFDAVKDFAPIAPAVANNNIITVHPSVPAKNIPEFVAYLRANPGQGVVRLGRHRHLAASRRRIVQGDDRHAR